MTTRARPVSFVASTVAEKMDALSPRNTVSCGLVARTTSSVAGPDPCRRILRGPWTAVAHALHIARYRASASLQECGSRVSPRLPQNGMQHLVTNDQADKRQVTSQHDTISIWIILAANLAARRRAQWVSSRGVPLHFANGTRPSRARLGHGPPLSVQEWWRELEDVGRQSCTLTSEQESADREGHSPVMHGQSRDEDAVPQRHCAVGTLGYHVVIT